MEKPFSMVIEGDCLQIMPCLAPGSIDLILCDLPYGTTRNTWDVILPFDILWENYKRLLSPKGVVLLMSQGLFTAKVIMSQEEMFKYKITWIKSKATNFLNIKKQPLRKHEDICVFYEKQPCYNPQMSIGDPYDKGYHLRRTKSYGEFGAFHVKSDGQRHPSDVVYFKTSESEGKVYHPTQKPVELGRYLIKTYTNPGDTVLDNCCGSGSFWLPRPWKEETP